MSINAGQVLALAKQLSAAMVKMADAVAALDNRLRALEAGVPKPEELAVVAAKLSDTNRLLASMKDD